MAKIAKEGVRELRLAVKDGNFKELVAMLEQTLVLKKLPGFKGCDPCRSGLDRIVIEAPELQQLMH